MSWNVKHATRNIPQPYRGIIARVIIVVSCLPILVFAAAIEGSKWCAEMACEVKNAWRDAGTW